MGLAGAAAGLRIIDQIGVDGIWDHVRGLSRRLIEGLSGMGVRILTARADESDRLLGFAVGGDDYVVKPFSMAELLARVGAIVRRSRQTSSAFYECADFRVDFERYKLSKNGEELALTYLESELLRYLTSHPGEAVSRGELPGRAGAPRRSPATPCAAGRSARTAGCA